MPPSTARTTEIDITRPARALMALRAAPVAVHLCDKQFRSVRWSLFALVAALLAWPIEVAWAQAGAGVPMPTTASAELQAPSRPVAAASGMRGPKRRMRIGFYVNAVRGVDWTAENFLVDFYWWIRYPKPASEEDRKLAEALEFVNGNLGARRRGPGAGSQERKTIPGPDGDEEYVAFRSVGRFYFDADFRRYPFDRQKLPIVIEHEVFTTEELELVDDEDSYRRASGPEERWGLATSLRVPDLEIERAARAFTTQDTARTSATRRTAMPRRVSRA